MTAPLSFSVAAPGKYLSMNDREHWRPRAGNVKAWRRAAYHAATALAAPTPADIHMRFVVPRGTPLAVLVTLTERAA